MQDYTYNLLVSKLEELGITAEVEFVCEDRHKNDPEYYNIMCNSQEDLNLCILSDKFDHPDIVLKVR